MPGTEVKVVANKLEAKVKIVEVTEKGEVVDRNLVTEVKIQYNGTPSQLDKMLYALRAGHVIDVTFTCPQSSLPLLEEEKELAGAC